LFTLCRSLTAPPWFLKGDPQGCYYVTSDTRQLEPMLLSPRTAYGISNGYIIDDWAKVSAGLGIFRDEVLPKYSKFLNYDIVKSTTIEQGSML
jgi:hypothetical protein